MTHAVNKRATDGDAMEFGEWEVDDYVFDESAEEGEVQESLPLRRTQLQLANATHPPAADDDVVDGVGDGVADYAKEVLLLVDAGNGFNNLSRYGMLWTVRYRWCKLFKFTFDCYRHEIRLVCCQPSGAADIILSKEGVTKSDHLTMAL